MAMTGIRALITADAPTRKGVREWHERRSGTNEPGPLAVLDVAGLVDRAARLYPLREDWLETKGREAIEWLRALLVERFGRTAAIPPVGELEDWIARHAAKHGRGKLTTAGIVAKIVHGGLLPGASSSPRPRQGQASSVRLENRHERLEHRAGDVS
jgi:hypothetical protein